MVTAFYRHWWTLQAGARHRQPPTDSSTSSRRTRRCVSAPPERETTREYLSTSRRKWLDDDDASLLWKHGACRGGGTAKMVVYQNGGFTPALSVSQWWLAGRGAVTRGLRGCSLATAYSPPSLVVAVSHRTTHAANHHCDTLQAWLETTILIHSLLK